MHEQTSKDTEKVLTLPESTSGISLGCWLHRGLKVTLNKVKDWLFHKDTYILLKPVSRRFKRRPVITGSIVKQFQAGLIDSKIMRDLPTK